MAFTLKIGLLLLASTQSLKAITAIGWSIKKHMHFRQIQVMFSNLSRCFRHSSFMFTASSEPILMSEFIQLSPLHFPHPTVHIKPCFLHENLTEWQFVLQLHFNTWSRPTAVPESETTFAKSDILLQMRFGATCRILLQVWKWIVLVSVCQV